MPTDVSSSILYQTYGNFTSSERLSARLDHCEFWIRIQKMFQSWSVDITRNWLPLKLRQCLLSRRANDGIVHVMLGFLNPSNLIFFNDTTALLLLLVFVYIKLGTHLLQRKGSWSTHRNYV